MTKSAIYYPTLMKNGEPVDSIQQEIFETALAKSYGGYTAVPAFGGYIMEDGRLMQEHVTMYIIYHEHADGKDLLTTGKALCELLKQECFLVELGGKPYFISDDDSVYHAWEQAKIEYRK